MKRKSRRTSRMERKRRVKRSRVKRKRRVKKGKEEKTKGEKAHVQKSKLRGGPRNEKLMISLLVLIKGGSLP